MKKRGAVELSMTTIIVIVIGIILLSLALVWVRGVFEELGILTSESFETSRGAIDDIYEGTKDPLVISPDIVSIEQGETKEVDIYVNNLGTSTITPQGTVEVVPADKASDIDCVFIDTFTTTTRTDYTLTSGKRLGLRLRIQASDNAVLGSGACSILVSGLPEGENRGQVLVNIESG